MTTERDHTPEQVAPWLVLLSKHMPIPVLDEAGWPDSVMCSCGSALYVGHLPGLILDKVYEIARRQSDNGETCHRCHGPNATWCAPSPLWNQVIREGSIDGDPLYGDLVCIACFITLAERMGLGSGRRWRLYLDPEPEGLQTVTPSGRIWDADSWLWRDPTDVVLPSASAGGS